MVELVSEIRWSKKDSRWICYLNLYGESFNRSWLEPGRNLSFKVMPGRYCVGYTELTNRKSAERRSPQVLKTKRSCPLNVKLRKGHQCSSCITSDVNVPCLICDGTRCLTDLNLIKERCMMDTAYVYLASFGKDIVKVGTTSKSRIPLRWIEQGANLAKRIIVDNGMKVREYERRIQRNFNVVSGLRIEKKVDTLWKLEIEEEWKVITKIEKKIKNQFKSFPFYYEDPCNLSSIYNISNINRKPIEIKINNGIKVFGRILGVKGYLLLLEVNDITYFINLKNLLGKRIEMGGVEKTSYQNVLDRYLASNQI